MSHPGGFADDTASVAAAVNQKVSIPYPGSNLGNATRTGGPCARPVQQRAIVVLPRPDVEV